MMLLAPADPGWRGRLRCSTLSKTANAPRPEPITTTAVRSQPRSITSPQQTGCPSLIVCTYPFGMNHAVAIAAEATSTPIATSRRLGQRRIVTATTAPPTPAVILIGSQPCGRYPVSYEVIHVGPPPGWPVWSTNRSPLLQAFIGRARATTMPPTAAAPAAQWIGRRAPMDRVSRVHRSSGRQASYPVRAAEMD